MPAWYQTTWYYGGRLLLVVAVTLTLVSGIGYLLKNRAVIQME
jgi:spore germination protein GerM